MNLNTLPQVLFRVVIAGTGFLILHTFYGPTRAADSDIETIRYRLVRDLKSDAVDGERVRELIKNMTEEGSWPDIDYNDRSRSGWEPLSHLVRLRKMALAFAGADRGLSGNQALLKRIESGLRFWFKRNPQSNNWWFGAIGRPNQLGPILLLLKEVLPEDLLREGIKHMPSELRHHKGTDMDEILNDKFLIHRGLVENNTDLIKKAFGHLGSELEVKSGIGIKADFSFHNHGPQLYSGNYGLGTVHAFARWVYFARGTRFAFPGKKVQLLADLLLKGYQWMTWYQLLDYGSLGRAITRKNHHDQARSLRPHLPKLAKLLPSRRKEFTDYYRHINGKPPSISGNKNFWLSDFMVHRRREYYTSVSLTSKDVVGTEIGNGEGVMNYYLPYGSNFIFHGRPNEYTDIFPVWNWTRVPGVTAPHAETPPMPAGRTMDWYGGLQGKTDFVGGVSDGRYGLSAFDYRLDDTSGRKSWFFFERAYVALGTGIQSGSDQPIVTTVNQCLRRGRVTYSTSNRSRKTLPHGKSRNVTSPATVFHDGIGYAFPSSGHRIHLGSRTQTGSWNRINTKYSKEEVSKRVFNLWQTHGRKPDKGRYFYVVVPGDESDGLTEYLSDQSPIQVISNKPNLQAIRHRRLGMTMLAFYEAGRSSIGGDRTVSVDTPCLVMVKRGENGYNVSVANPEGDSANIQVQIFSKQNKKAIGERTFELHGGQQGGRTVTRTLGRN